METNKTIPLEEDYAKYKALKALQRDLQHALNLEDEEEENGNYCDLERRVQERLNFYRELGVKG